MGSSSTVYDRSFLSLSSRRSSQRARTRFSPSAAPICSPSMESSSTAYNRSFLSLSPRRSSQRAWRRFPPFARRSCSPSIMDSSFPPSAAPSCPPLHGLELVRLHHISR